MTKPTEEGFSTAGLLRRSRGLQKLAAFNKQDCFYTNCVQGQEANGDFEEVIVNAAISRVLHTGSDWQQMLEYAHNPEMKIYTC